MPYYYLRKRAEDKNLSLQHWHQMLSVVSGQLFRCHARYIHSIRRLRYNKRKISVYKLFMFWLVGKHSAPVSKIVGHVLISTAAAASLDFSSFIIACVVSIHADLLTCKRHSIKNFYKTSEWILKWFHIHADEITSKLNRWRKILGTKQNKSQQ